MCCFRLNCIKVIQYVCPPGVLHHGDLAPSADGKLHHCGPHPLPEAAFPGELPVPGLCAAAGVPGWCLHLPVLHAHLVCVHLRF